MATTVRTVTIRRETIVRRVAPILIVVASVITNVIGRQPQRTSQLSASIDSAKTCLGGEEISTALQVLSHGPSYEDQQKAVALLKASAERSPVCRKQVVTSLMSDMDQPDLDLTAGTPQFFLWHYGAKLLGELKAVEALDLLVTKSHLHDGSGFPFNHYPALGGIIDMGEVALPKLQAVLTENSNPDTRQLAVFCIALIGGPSAEQILRQALPGESDACTVSCIRATLNSFANEGRPHQISDVGRTEWYTTFLCKGE